MTPFPFKQKTKNEDLDEHGIKLLIDKKIAEAKVMIAEKRLNFLLAIGAAFLTIFGIITPMFLSIQSEKKVDAAIEKMETKFNELAGKQLRKPQIACYIDGKNLVNNVIRFGPDEKLEKAIFIKNVGDGATEHVTMHLYLNSEHDKLDNILWFDGFEQHGVNDKPEFKLSFRYDRDAFILPAKDSFSIGLQLANFHLIKRDTIVTAILKIFYGEPAPQEVPFTIEIEKRSDNKALK